MLSDSAIRVDKYKDACGKAVDDLANVFEPMQAVASDRKDVYTRFLPMEINAPTEALEAFGIWDLVARIAKNLGYTIGIFPRNRPLDGYVSWLIVNSQRRELSIIYDVMKVAGVFPLCEIRPTPNEDDKVTRSRVLNSKTYTYACEKIFGKILLHEIGHASLHGEMYRDGDTTQDGRVIMPPECESQAWVYAHTAWGILVGDDSYAARTLGGRDEGYLRS